MTIKQFKQIIENIPDECELDIYDLRSYTHPKYDIDTQSYFDYDNGRQIVTIHIKNE